MYINKQTGVLILLGGDLNQCVSLVVPTVVIFAYLCAWWFVCRFILVEEYHFLFFFFSLSFFFFFSDNSCIYI